MAKKVKEKVSLAYYLQNQDRLFDEWRDRSNCSAHLKVCSGGTVLYEGTFSNSSELAKQMSLHMKKRKGAFATIVRGQDRLTIS